MRVKNLKKHYPGCYRMSIDQDEFGQFIHVVRNYGRARNFWRSEWRNEYGDIKRDCGRYKTLQEAVHEFQHAVEEDSQSRAYKLWGNELHPSHYEHEY